MKRMLIRVGRWCRRHKLVLAALCVIVAIAFLPMFPYSPRCYSPDVDEVEEIHLASRYRVELTGYLEIFHVRYVVLGDVVLLPFWDWFADPDSWVANASNKAVIDLADPKSYPWLGDPPPARIAHVAEVARDPEGFIEATCELVRAVAIEGW